MIREISCLTEQTILIVTDSWFGNISIWKEIKDLARTPKILTRLRIDANLFHFPTDLTLSSEQMIEYYSARWKIESGFKEIKHEIGALDTQARKRNAVENHFNFCYLAVMLVWIYAMKQEKAPKRRYPNVTRHFSFSDIREQIRKEYNK